MTTTADKILIRPIHGRFNDSYEVGGHTIYKDIENTQDTWRFSISGEVAAVPENLSKENPFNPYVEGIKQVIEVGMICWFHFNTFQEENLVMINGERFYSCDYSGVFAVQEKPNSDLIMVGGWVLVEPIKEGGNLGSLIDPNEKVLSGTGIVRHIGEPRTGHELNPAPKAGDRIWFKEVNEFENEIAGKKYWCVRQSAIDMIEEQIDK